MRTDRPMPIDPPFDVPRVFANEPPLHRPPLKPGLIERIRQWHDRRQYPASSPPPAPPVAPTSRG
jgi:hypothetical protein